VSRRPVALVSALTAADYLLWNWALSGGHEVLALVAGLTLPPLVAACALMFALGLARVLGRSSQRSAAFAGALAGTLASSIASSLASVRRRRRLAAARRRALSPRVSLPRSTEPAGKLARREARTRILADAETPPSSPDGLPASNGAPARSSRKLAA